MIEMFFKLRKNRIVQMLCNKCKLGIFLILSVLIYPVFGESQGTSLDTLEKHFEFYLEPSVESYGNVSTLSYSGGTLINLGLFNHTSKQLWYDPIYFGASASYDKSSISGVFFLPVCIYGELGYGFQIPKQLTFLRVMPSAKFGVAYVNWTDSGSEKSGVGFVVTPQLSIDLTLPFFTSLYVGAGVGYRLLYFDDQSWKSLVSELRLGYRF